jgi:APA family basic amino acid/polyamine antiporter
MAMVFSRYAAQLVPLDPLGQRVVAVLVVLVLSAVNYVGVRVASGVQTALTFLKVAAVVGLVAVLFAWGAPEAAAATMEPAPEGGYTLRNGLLALVAGLFAYGGWHMVAYASEETRDPERTIPRALVVGTLVVTACYLALNAGYLRVLGVARMAASQTVAADAANVVLGNGGARLTALIVTISILGALSGVVLAGPRLYWAMARDGLLFRSLAEVHPRYQTPHRAVVLQALWASVLVATGSYRTLFTRVVYTEWLFFGMMALGLLVLRRRTDYRAPYRAPGGPLLPLAFAGATALIVVNQVVSEPVSSAVGIAFVLAGLPVYLAWQRRAPAERPAA